MTTKLRDLPRVQAEPVEFHGVDRSQLVYLIL